MRLSRRIYLAEVAIRSADWPRRKFEDILQGSFDYLKLEIWKTYCRDQVFERYVQRVQREGRTSASGCHGYEKAKGRDRRAEGEGSGIAHLTASIETSPR